MRAKYANIVNETINKEIVTIEPLNLYEPIVYGLSSGGKRIRPVLCMLACDLTGGNGIDALYPAIGVELFHNFTLFHDDIMDKALIRRGQPTVCRKWNDNIAILSGDALFTIANHYVCKTDKNLANVLKSYNKATLQVCEGQQYDMDFETKNYISEIEYIEMIRLKTSVLLAAALEIGGLIAGAHKDDIEHLYKFGENIGLAFQLKDDYLDTFANTATFGKAIGGDIIENKKTYLYVKALEIANHDEKSVLEHYYSSTDFNSDEKIKNVTTLYQSLQIDKIIAQKMQEYHHTAIQHLQSIANANKVVLQDFLDFAEELFNREK